MDEMTPDLVINKVLGKISDVLLNGDGDVIPKSDDHYLAFMSPGIPVADDEFNYAIEGFGGVSRRNVDRDAPADSLGGNDDDNTDSNDSDDEVSNEELAANDTAKKYRAAENFFALTDLLPDTSNIVDANRINNWSAEGTLSKAYAIALQMSQVYDIPLDDDTKAKLERWRSKLVETKTEIDIVTDEEIETVGPSRLSDVYHEYEQKWIDAALAVNSVRIASIAGDEAAKHNWAINGVLLQQKVRSAMREWVASGHKDDYERLVAAIAAVEGRSFALLKEQYKDDFARSVLTSENSGANFLYTAPMSPGFITSDSGWTEVTLSKGELDYESETLKTKTSAGGFGSIFGIAIGGSGGSTNNEFTSTMNTKDFNMSFKIARIPIYRPWLNLPFIHSGFWRFDQNNAEYKNTMLSDGESPADGLMPAITTECIFIKDLKLDMGEYNEEFSREVKSVSGSGGLFWGPVNFGASHSRNESEEDFHSDWERQGLHIDGIQLLGFMCYNIPKSPNPNPDIDSWI